MNSVEIDLFELSSNLGLRKKKEDVEPGVKFLPKWLKSNGFHKGLSAKNVFSLFSPEYLMQLDKKSQVLNIHQVRKYALKQSDLLLENFDSGNFQLSLGGDCSILLGAALALKQRGNYGLFFLDGHTDFVLPDSSQTKAVAGMDLAIVAGHGPELLTNISGLRPYFKEQNIYCIGNRVQDEDYLRPIKNSLVNYVDLPTLRSKGMRKVAVQFLEMVKQKKLDGFFIHFDVDALNHDLMPAVDSPVQDGITYEELADLMVPLLESDMAVGMEITILDPTLDKEGVFTKPFVDNMLQIISDARIKG